MDGQGFQPGETVALWWDGWYRGYLMVLPEGTWSVEWCDQARSAVSGHNLHPCPGTHQLLAVGDRGDRAWYERTVR